MGDKAITLKISAAIITVDRSPRTNYLADTITSLQQSGVLSNPAFSLAIHHSGEASANIDVPAVAESNVNIVRYQERLSITPSMVNAMRYACAENPDYVLFMEDDIEVCQDFPEFVIATLEEFGASPVMDFATYYREVVDAYFEGKRCIEMDANTFYGAQCFTMACNDMRCFADYIERNYQVKPGYPDTWFDSWMHETGRAQKVFCAVPSAAQHVGADSSLGHQPLTGQAYKVDLEKAIPGLTDEYQVIDVLDEGLRLRHRVNGSLLKLNESAKLIYLYCDSGLSLGEIVEQINNELSICKTLLSSHIRQGLASLVEKSVVSFNTE